MDTQKNGRTGNGQMQSNILKRLVQSAQKKYGRNILLRVMEASGMYSRDWSFAWSPCFSRLFLNIRGRLKAGLQARTHALRTLIKQKNDIQTTLRELPLDKLEKLGEMLAELESKDQ